MPKLKLLLLGPPQVLLSDSSVTFDTRKATALLAYLAVNGHPQRRETLASLFWPEADESRARAALRRTLSVLGKGLSGEWLQAERETIQLGRRGELSLDVDSFRLLLGAPRNDAHPPDEVCDRCLPSLEEAADLYRGDFLAGFTLRDAPEFDEWQFFQAEALRAELAGALANLAQGYAAHAQWERAIGHGRRWLALDPLDEAAHRMLMRLYAWSNQRTAALRQYQRCADILDEELGVPPSPETRALKEAIEAGRAPSLNGAAPHADKAGERGERSPLIREAGLRRPLKRSPGPERRSISARRLPAHLPLVGREKEWKELVQAYEAADVHGQLVVIEGEAGIGKTRLAQEFMTRAVDEGAVALSARCYPGELNLSYGPFIQMLQRALLPTTDSSGAGPPWLREAPPHSLSETARLLPEMRAFIPDLPQAAPLEGPGAQARFFEGVRLTLVHATRAGRPAVLFFDDLHEADEASQELLRYLLHRLTDWPVLLLSAWRSEGVPAYHPLRTMLAEASRSDSAEHLPLGPLNEGDVASLVASLRLDEDLPVADLIGRLHRESEGLPFYLVEYLETVVSKEGDLLHGEWQMPRGVQDLIRSRVAALSENQRQLLSAASVIGRYFDHDALRAATGRDDEQFLSELEGLLQVGVIAEQGTQETSQLRYDFRHDKLREFVYQQTSLARRRLLHRRVAEDLLGGIPTPNLPDAAAGTVARHFFHAGERTRAAEFFLLAGDHARGVYANAQALTDYRAALDLGHPDPAALHERIGDLLVLQGDYAAAQESYDAALSGSPQDPARLRHKLGSLHQRRGAWQLAEANFHAALEGDAKPVSAGQQARVYADWSLTAHLQGNSAQAQDYAKRAMALAQAAGEAAPLAQAHNLLGILARGRQDVDAARRHLEESLALAKKLGDPVAQIAALNNLALVAQASGDAQRGLDLLRSALGLCESIGDRHRAAALYSNLADLLRAAGRSDEAMQELKRSAAILSQIDAKDGVWQPEIWKLVEW
ncbi:MAG TPA: AAA family ATPase [Anaerolineales bacterium]|nr:AAA family ATPase [Anaerolineales bacterium]